MQNPVILGFKLTFFFIYAKCYDYYGLEFTCILNYIYWYYYYFSRFPDIWPEQSVCLSESGVELELCSGSSCLISIDQWAHPTTSIIHIEGTSALFK